MKVDKENESQQSTNSATPSTANSHQRTSPPDFGNDVLLRARGLERTNNKHGFMFLRVDEPTIAPWLSALPESGRPIADLGACYGVHTIHALKQGRDVIALDADPLHMRKLRERVSPLETPGRLLDAIVATLPCSELFEDSCFAGVLVSEMVHFLPPGGPQQLFKDIHRWLMPGGTLVATSVSPSILYNGNGKEFKYNGNISYERALELFTNVPDDIVQLAPGFVELPSDWKSLGLFPDNMYFMTCEEMGAFAEMAKFVIDTCRYYRAGKYVLGNVSDSGDGVLLVARKPMDLE